MTYICSHEIARVLNVLMLDAVRIFIRVIESVDHCVCIANRCMPEVLFHSFKVWCLETAHLKAKIAVIIGEMRWLNWSPQKHVVVHVQEAWCNSRDVAKIGLNGI